MIIASLENKEIKRIYKLQQKKYREEYQEFLVEGEHLVEEALKAGVLKKVIILENTNYNFDIEKLIVTENVMRKLSSLETPPNIIGICSMIKENEIKDKVLILDNLQDPGNLGTIIRSSVAFNIDTIILSENCVDLYNSKVIRSTQGMIFYINIIKRDLKEEIRQLKDENYTIYTTNVVDGEDIRCIEKNNKYALIIGNEGNGVREEIANLADKKIYIKTNENVESLNAGVATSILLYELGR